jgi:hypothetical protein
MTNAPQHKLSRWLTSVLQPVMDKYADNCVIDSFSFANNIRNLKFSGDVIMCSFDIKSLFTNVPVSETIKICADAMFEQNLNTTQLNRAEFIDLMTLATCNVEFSFNGMMYRQTEGVAMGSQLGPILANIFVGFYEAKLFSMVSKPLVYTRYVDDTFAVFVDEHHRARFESYLNNLHPCLKFTSEIEVNRSIAFLDVLIHKRQGAFLTQVFRKPTFTGEYTKWRSFCDVKRKINLIKNLTHRALMLCSDEFLEVELTNIKSIFNKNGYPDKLVSRTIVRKIDNFRQVTPSTPEEEEEQIPVYLRLPYIGTVSGCYRQKITTAVTACYKRVKPRIIFTSRPMLPSSTKDTLPSHQRSNLIYLFKCGCESTYVGRTHQRLSSRIREHIPLWLEKILGSPSTRSLEPAKSAVANHLMKNTKCAKNFTKDMFTILVHGRSSFHLSALEALNISSRRPPLCRQKKFVHSMLLFKHLGTGL